MSSWFAILAEGFDKRTSGRFKILLGGALFAQGLRTVTSWFRAAGVGVGFKPFYYTVSSVGKQTVQVAWQLFVRILLPRLLGVEDRLLFAIDDTPTKRYGPAIEGAGRHHNPTPGPAGSAFCYGHVWVTLALVQRHPQWGAIALPLLAQLYVRNKDMGPLRTWYQWQFKTKLDMAAEMIAWLAQLSRLAERPAWLVTDGAYATRPVMKAAAKAGVTLVSRLRHDAALYDLPKPEAKKPAGKKKRGRKPVYGKNRIDLGKRAAQPHGWRKEEFELYGKKVEREYKSFQATWRPAGGKILVVLVKRTTAEQQKEAAKAAAAANKCKRKRKGKRKSKRPRDWVAYYCTNPEATVAEVLTAVADRGSLEQGFKDMKEVEGVGEQQLRNIWANVGAYHIGMWIHTLTEWWAWDRPAAELVDRSASPWDSEPRRPSHADRRKALRTEGLREQFRRAACGRHGLREILRLAQGLLKIVA